MIHIPWRFSVGFGCFFAAIIVAFSGFTSRELWDGAIGLIVVAAGVNLLATSIGEIG